MSNPNQSNDAYAADRKDPTNAVATGIKIMFDSANLSLQTPKFIYSYKAVSGKPDDKGNFDYSVSRQKMKNIGPIPEGAYWIDPSEIWENAWYKIGSSTSAWGNYRVIIHPYPKTETWGRGGMFIHGGDTYGSAGCVDLRHLIDKFIERLREYTGGFKACYVPVTVAYPKP